MAGEANPATDMKSPIPPPTQSPLPEAICLGSTSVNEANEIRCLVTTADKHPCTRPDVAELFVNRLQRKGYRFDWLMQSFDQTQPTIDDWEGGRVWVGPTTAGGGMIKSIRRLVLGVRHDLRLYGLVRHGDYDLVIVKDKFLSVLIAMLVQRRLKVPFIYWLSFPFPESVRYKAQHRKEPLKTLEVLRSIVMAKILYRLVPRYARHIMVQSQWMQSDLGQKGIPEAHMTAIPMGVSVEDATIAIAEDQSCCPRRAVYIGALNRARRLDFLLRAFKIVVSRFPRAELCFVGSASHQQDEEMLRELAASLDIQRNVRFLGHQPPEGAWKVVRGSLFGVSPIPPTPEFLPSSPTKLVEYLALERAVVVNDIPDQKLVLESSQAGRCVTYNEEEFAEAMIDLFRDPDATLEMGRRGRAWVEHHRSYGAIADQTSSMLAATLRANRLPVDEH